ncbi:hypothetical protein GCM10011376_34210 [Nocardioides flavus (ex Wang et al. 2016)]|uniref:Lipoprotein n=1 Tax=Nocardioides flavus (ex Wang et al. 2016) TaxID=2058780 RepID=A0ABQ3HQ41_9ACTN|nr:hypothetical protein GCM10011376_34210 [Nocardioides flavus (ex Wang et al. 2016)]
MLTLFSGRHFMHVRRALALTLAVPVLLAGCSDDPEPTPKMPESTSSSPSPSPTETKEPEAESPEEFIRRWAAIEAEMENTGDTSEYRALSERCRACNKLADLVEQYYRAGGFVEWDGWTIRSIRAQGDEGTYLVRVNSAPTRYVEKSGGKEKFFPGGSGAHLIRLAPAGSSWKVVDKSEVDG